MRLKCVRHQVLLEIDGNNRRITLPEGSWGPRAWTVGRCVLLVMKEPRTGKIGECEVIEE